MRALCLSLAALGVAATAGCDQASGEDADAVAERLLGAWVRVDAETGAPDWSVCDRELPVVMGTTILPGRRWGGDLYFEPSDEADVYAGSGGPTEMDLSEARLSPRGDAVRMQAWGNSYDLAFGEAEIDGAARETLTVTYRGGATPNPRDYVRCSSRERP